MMLHRLAVTAIAAAFAIGFGASPAAAKGGSSPKGAKAPKTTTHGPSATAAHGPKVTTHSKTTHSATSAGVASAPKGAHSATSAGTASAPKGAHDTKGAHATKETDASGKGPKKGEKTPQLGTPQTGPAMTRAQQQLAKNANLRSKVQSRLPAGTDVNAAASGFRNLGQFVAAVNVSNNLRIPFEALKALMTGPNAMSLGQAIQQLKGTDAGTANRMASAGVAQANADLSATGTATTVSATSAGAAGTTTVSATSAGAAGGTTTVPATSAGAAGTTMPFGANAAGAAGTTRTSAKAKSKKPRH